MSRQALAAENPDELYEQGRFAEAEKAYAGSDMDHPKDIRYRYNRGCAAYQGSDYQGAMAAFSSVLRRAQDDEIRFKTAYNLGNTAFKQGDFQSAAAHYKQAIVYNPEGEDAKYNLELTLKELEKLKQKQDEDSKTEEPQEDSGQTEGQGDQSKTDQQGEDPDKSSQEKESGQEPSQESSQAQDQKEEKGQSESGKEAESEQEKGTGQDQGHQAEQDAPKDLSGDLKPMDTLPEEQEDDQAPGAAMSMIDKRKAEALLDNVKEDRARFLQFQVPEEKKRGVSSGRDW